MTYDDLEAKLNKLNKHIREAKDILTTPYNLYEPLEEMATIRIDEEDDIRITVNPAPGKIGVPYFKAFSDMKANKGESAVARCHFFDTGMEYHNGDGFRDWVIGNREVKRIKRVLLRRYKKTTYTAWDMAKFKWNLEYKEFLDGKIISDDEEKYFSGYYDKIPEYYNHPSYVPSTIKIPDTWIYNPPKNKNKRKFKEVFSE